MNKMLPKFPNFKRLEMNDKSKIEFFTKDFPPYSDFNFTSLWCWDIYEKILISELNDNLIVKFTDYITGEPFYSFIGTNKVIETTELLLQLAKKEGINEELKLIPQESYELAQNEVSILEDQDNFDYIYSIEALKTYKGNKFGAKRNFVNRFKKNYISSTAKLDLSDESTKIKILEMFFIWASSKELKISEIKNEYKAITRLFDLKNPKIIGVGIYINEKLASFSINEIVNKDYSILHFEKGNLDSYIGLFPFTLQETARILSNFGIKFLNFEQDLGISGLRRSKLSYNPCTFLKQYTFSPLQLKGLIRQNQSRFAVALALE